ncbi:hypothetical protein chiPu_0012777 [Chiloscyllium punctatum]|uniref:Uncharacterized protein n=1 Tax=Chiloscyllium punctatum TaxID=137246 RepID=A0A401SV61_CHIPU|nr:hypothetical protein [Chiloscyllium punctatum]
MKTEEYGSALGVTKVSLEKNARAAYEKEPELKLKACSQKLMMHRTLSKSQEKVMQKLFSPSPAHQAACAAVENSPPRKTLTAKKKVWGRGGELDINTHAENA